MITVTILSGGKELDATFELYGVDVSVEFNRIPWARLSFLDGDAAKPEFKATNSSALQPGKKIEIKMQLQSMEGKKGKPAIFKGIVVGQRLELDAGQSILVVEIQDESMSLNGSRQTRVFEKKKDSEIMKDIVTKVNKLEAGNWQDSVYQHEKMIQFDCTDWDFLISRAEANGFLVSVNNGKLSLVKADASPGKVHKLINGNSDIFDLEMESDAGDQFKKASAVGWDLKNQKPVTNSANSTYKSQFGNPAETKVLNSITRKVNGLFYGGITTAQELTVWSKAVETRSKLSVMRGRVSVPGMSELQLGDFIELQGLGKRFDGKALISGFRHRIDPGSWTTDIQLGFSAEPFWKNDHIVSPPAAGLLPGVNGLHIGVVTKFEEDPNKEFRVGVKLATADDDSKSFVWARLSTIDGGKGRGCFFYPEVDDEVVLGFLNDDPRQAIILGSLFGSRHTPPTGFDKVDKENAQKGIVTKSGHSLIFDDKEQMITIRTSEKNMVVMDEKNKKIEVKDEHGNIILMSEDGISIKSDKAIKFEVGGNKLSMDDNGVEFKSAKKMILEASANMEIKGAQIEMK